jgi:hypothetical protein
MSEQVSIPLVNDSISTAPTVSSQHELKNSSSSSSYLDLPIANSNDQDSNGSNITSSATSSVTSQFNVENPNASLSIRHVSSFSTRKEVVASDDHVADLVDTFGSKLQMARRYSDGKDDDHVVGLDSSASSLATKSNPPPQLTVTSSVAPSVGSSVNVQATATSGSVENGSAATVSVHETAPLHTTNSGIYFEPCASPPPPRTKYLRTHNRSDGGHSNSNLSAKFAEVCLFRTCNNSL